MELATDQAARGRQTWDEAAAWHHALAGDGEAFGLIFDRHRDRVFRHAWRMTSTRHDAEDVTASAFLELWRRRHHVRLVDGSVLAWLLVTTTNLSRNVVRASRRYRQVLERLPRTAAQPDVADSALDGALGVDQRLATGLRELSPTDGHLFVLIALEGFTVTAAAGQLGLSESAARARLHRARSALRARMGDVVPSTEGGGTR